MVTNQADIFLLDKEGEQSIIILFLTVLYRLEDFCVPPGFLLDGALQVLPSFPLRSCFLNCHNFHCSALNVF